MATVAAPERVAYDACHGCDRLRRVDPITRLCPRCARLGDTFEPVAHPADRYCVGCGLPAAGHTCESPAGAVLYCPQDGFWLATHRCRATG